MYIFIFSYTIVLKYIRYSKIHLGLGIFVFLACVRLYFAKYIINQENKIALLK